MTSKRRTGRAPPEKRTGTTTGLEWLLAFIGLALVVGALAVLLHQATTGGNGPPAIATEVVSVRPVDGAYRVEVRVSNRGGQTAAELKLAGILSHPGGGAETSDTVIDYLPPHSSRTVTFSFARDPRAAELSVRVVSLLDF